jgi:hypothetical protein
VAAGQKAMRAAPGEVRAGGAASLLMGHTFLVVMPA